MKFRMAVVCALLLSVIAGLPVLAHEETHKGTVIALEKTGVRVTKILRGDTVLTVATAKFAKGEAIAVTVDHDADEHLALVIRFGAAK